MKKVKKVLVSAVMAALVASTFTPAVSAVEVKPTTSAAAYDDMAFDHPFTDVGTRYEEAVNFLYNMEILKGTTATSFGTHQNLTRGDAAVILANTLGLDTENAPDAGFKDLNSRVRGSVNALAELGVIAGKTSDTFGKASH